MVVCEEVKCTGCHACFSICPKECISMIENSEGFLYPEIDKNKCIKCKKCQKVCPVNNQIVFKDSIVTYAAWSIDKSEQTSSTSGGIASTFSRHVVQNKGYVFGAAYNDLLQVNHEIASNEEQILKFKGSKYFQSVIGKSYCEVKEKLNQGKKVLFIGTPCQVSGLIKYLDKEYVNLITVDIICHGVPSYKIVKKYITEIEKKLNIKADKLVFRDKSGFKFTLMNGKKVVYSKESTQDNFYIGFLKGLFYRKCCYICNYAKPKRISDITIGDFWGLGKNEVFNYSQKDGISVCMVNTEKGLLFIDEVKDEVELIKRSSKEAIDGNKQLRQPSKLHPKREQFFKQLDKKGFIKTTNNLLFKEKVAYRLINFIRRIK